MSALRIGTRGSALAVAQTRHVADRIAAATGAEVELVTVTTHGDVSRRSLAELGGTGVFAGALRESLAAGDCDLVVHSLKDLPTAPAEGLRLGAVPVRADARDALCARDGLTLAELPEGARIGTGSPRRVAQLREARPDLEIVDIRGNVDTQLRFVSEGRLDAVVLAAAGLGRLARADAITDLFALSEWPTAPGQGALALEVRDEPADPVLAGALAAVEHAPTRAAVTAERDLLAVLEAGCAAPIGATAVIDAELLFLTATVWAPDGSRRLTSSHAASLETTAPDGLLEAARDVATRAGRELLDTGASDLAPLGASA